MLRDTRSWRPALRFGLQHPKNRPVQKNILICAFPSALHPAGQPAVALTPDRPAFRFTAGQFRMEPRADLEQRSNVAPHLDPPLRLLRDPRKNLEQSRFPRPIPPDDPENLGRLPEVAP